MLRNIFRRQVPMLAENENAASLVGPSVDSIPIANVRALATGAALATSIDSSTAALVSIYDYAHRYRDKGRRSA
jgi:hypothetical protein